MTLLRGLLAVLSGLVTMVLVIVLGTVVLSLAAGGLATEERPPALYLAANLLVSAVAAALGGAVTYRLAPRRPWWHALALAGVMIVMGTASGFTAAPGQPRVYPIGVLLLGLTGVLAGARWVERRGRLW